ncbi:Imm63 family immunity protein [Brucella intermedia]|uniref:Imm63 family immunity protein n=1 Tax=Brucella intermedia TaxID=94625 RepID=UPI00124C0762|nr:Imm63 family immunity protein [Brucella intermedia]KAB2721484.1 hypothetical protein F9L02_23155 [Brucella intermedia]
MHSLLKNIEMAYIEYAAKWNQSDITFPFGTTPTGDGGRHIEISADGKMALVGTDRSLETTRQDTYSLNELLYWIFSAQAESRGWKYELAHRHPNEDPRRVVFSKALEEIGKLNPNWRERMKCEQEEILRKHPFNDGSRI